MPLTITLSCVRKLACPANPGKSRVLITLCISFPLTSLSLCLLSKTQFFSSKLQTCSLSFLSPSPTLHLLTFPALTGLDACMVGPIFVSSCLSSPSLALLLFPCSSQSFLAFVFLFSKVVRFQVCIQVSYCPLPLFLNLADRRTQVSTRNVMP